MDDDTGRETAGGQDGDGGTVDSQMKWQQLVSETSSGMRADYVRRQADRQAAAAASWSAAQRHANQLLADAQPRLRRHRRGLGDAARRLPELLAALVMAAEHIFGNARPATVAVVVRGYVADTKAQDAVDADGNITPKTMAYQVLDHLMEAKELGVSAPHDAVDEWSGLDQFEALADALLTVLDAGRSSFFGGSNHESSALNFSVPIAAPTGRSLQLIRADLDQRPGLAGIKNVLDQFAAVEQVNAMRRAHGLTVDTGTRHMIFTGNPGTGKTTVARLVAEILDATGSLPGAHLVEADRSMLIGEWLGTSALKTRKVCEAALGGVLFIDEAYSLAGVGQGNHGAGADRFAHEALATLLKIMEDDRDELVVILAGYPSEMANLVTMNPGLTSRIGLTIDFPDYTDSEIVDIFVLLTNRADYLLAPHATAPIRAAVAAARAQPGFGNARWARTVLEAAIRAHAQRLTGDNPPDLDVEVDVADLQTLRLHDVQAALRQLAGR